MKFPTTTWEQFFASKSVTLMGIVDVADTVDVVDNVDVVDIVAEVEIFRL